MRFKKFSLILILFLFPFFASAQNYFQVVTVHYNVSGLSLSVGDTVEWGAISSAVVGKKYFNAYGKARDITRANPGLGSTSQLYHSRGGPVTWFTYINVSGCPEGQIVDDSGKCSNSCPDGQKYDMEGQCVCNDGTKPNLLGVCDDYCNSEEYRQLRNDQLIMCSNTGGKFTSECNGRNDVTFNCSDDDGDGDGGGTGDGDGGGTGDGDGGGDGDPDPDPDKDDNSSDVISAIDDMRLDNNTRLDKLLASSDDGNSKLDGIKESIDGASEKNSEGLKGINDGISGLGESIDALKASGDANALAQLNATKGNTDAIHRLSDVTDEIHNAITGVNTAYLGKNVCSVGTCKSFYSKTYEDGLEGVFDGRYSEIKNVVVDGISRTTNNINFGGSARPTYTASFDFGFVNYGSFNIYDKAHLGMIFAFLRSFFMACALFYARSLIFGG